MSRISRKWSDGATLVNAIFKSRSGSQVLADFARCRMKVPKAELDNVDSQGTTAYSCLTVQI